MPATLSCDVAIVGGGLAGGLLALAIKRKRPDCDVRLIEESRRIGGNHLWSFFASDLGPDERWLVAPLISHGWTTHSVAFPGHRRTLRAPYYSVESERLDELVRAVMPAEALMLKRKVLGASAKAVVLADGDRVEAGGVIDCRGPGDLSHLDCGWQKFLGQALRLAEPHDRPYPMVMDATVAQIDGYRFVYTLPLSATRMFVEDTCYSDTPDIDAAAFAARIADYAAQQGWRVEQVDRQEGGSLPIAMGGDFEEYWRSGGNRVAKAGMRAGMFHPLTGYSLPDAARMAMAVAGAADLSGTALHERTHGIARRAWKKRKFYRMLSAMLFRAAEPGERYRILERFYRLDAGLITRFYAGQSTMFDRLRVLSGKPPVPVGRALVAIREKKK